MRRLLLLLLATLSFLPIQSQLTCSQGVSADGNLPSDWSRRDFTLVISTITIPTTRNSTKAAIVINGTIPGPRLDVSANDWVSITVINQLSTVTALHWHGLLLYSTPHLDGVPGLTQCGIPAGGSMTYSFCAAPSGTFWYHGHIDGQYIEGLYGPLIIASANHSSLTSASLYQHDWVWQAADFYNQNVVSTLLPWFLSPASEGREPQPDSLVVNGAFSRVSHLYAQSNETALLRLINSASLCMLAFAIDGVALTVVEVEGTEVQPYTVSSIMLNVAQRTVVSVSFADLRARYPLIPAIYYRVTLVCDADFEEPFAPPYESNFTQFTNWTGIIHLDSPGSTSSPPYGTDNNDGPTLPVGTPAPLEMNLLDARPINYDAVRSGVAVGSIPSATQSLALEIIFQDDVWGVNRGYINNVTYDMTHLLALDPNSAAMTDSMMPTLYDAYISPAPSSTSTVIVGDGAGSYAIPYGAVLDVTLINKDTGEHPFHLHGQPFWLLATSDYPEAESLYAGAWLMRDTVSIPAEGWAKLRFIADNPGVWMLHCHMDWHMEAGLSVVFDVGLERVNPGFIYMAPQAYSQCSPSIQSQLQSAQLAWTAPSSSFQLSQNGKIALGVVFGIGVPVFLAAVITWWWMSRADRGRKDVTSDEVGVRYRAHEVELEE